MNKKFKGTISIIMSIIMIFSVCSFAFAEDITAAPATDDGETAVTGFTDEDYLVTKGRNLVNQKGEKVQLKGVNLGGWMIQEDWLCPYEEVSDHIDIIETLTERFGQEKAYELLNTYEDNWITEYDLDQIKEMGFNCVRVPFWFRNFYYDDNGTKILDADGNWDFSRLDWVVSECSKREIYVILDMHGAVGYQSDANHCGDTDNGRLYEDSEQGERYRELTDELWTAIASRFVGNPAVAMYDLLNEPMCEVDSTEVKRRTVNTSLYERLYKTVREADADHVITLECIWTAVALPHSYLKGWTNVVYQVHFYNNSNFIFGFFLFWSKVWHFNVPLMVGEFYPLGSTTWDYCFDTMNKLGYNWLTWTYKAAGHGMWESDWCLKGSRDGFERAKIATDSYEEIARKWGECIRTENGYVDSGHYETVAPFLG